MTTAIAQYNWVKTADAASQNAFILGTKALLLAAGLIQAGDSGQLSTPVTTYITPASNYIGYLMFRFPDALQATTPIFIRVDFRTELSQQNPYAQFSVAGSTNGAGVLGTPTFVRTNDVYAPSGSTWQTGLNNYACYVDGTFTCALGPNVTSSLAASNNAVATLVVDRARNNTGVAQAGAFIVEGGAHFTSTSIARHMYGPASTALQQWLPALIPSDFATSSSDGAQVNVFRHYLQAPGVKPTLGMMTYYNAEFGALAPVTATVLGSSHTYLPLGQALTHASVNAQFTGSAAFNHCGMIRWE